MNQNVRNIFAFPPWSGQPVRQWIRACAWVWVVIVALIMPLAVYLTWQDGGISKQYWLAATCFIFGEIYFTLLLLHVALKGVAPTTWAPWK